MTCPCQTTGEPVDLATLNATLGRIDTSLASILALMASRFNVPSISEGASVHQNRLVVWTLANSDTDVRVEVRPADDLDVEAYLSLNIYIAADSAGSGSIVVARERITVPAGKDGINHLLSIQAKVPKGSYWLVEPSITSGSGTVTMNTDYTRIILTEAK